MNDTFEATRGKISEPKVKGVSSDILRLVLEINRHKGTLQKAEGVVIDDNGIKIVPAVDENGKPVSFRYWPHRDIIISETEAGPVPAGATGRDGCGAGYVLIVINGINCCVPY